MMTTTPNSLALIRTGEEPLATAEEAASAMRFAYDPALSEVLVRVDAGNYEEWRPFRAVEDERDALHLVTTLNSICVLFDGLSF